MELDPHELTNRAGEESYEARVQLWRERLVVELDDREEGYVQNGKLISGQKPKTSLSHIVSYR
ncbi:Arylsulfatase [compost metagenome]